MIKGIYKDKRAKNESDTVFIQSVSDFISHSTNMSLYWVCRVKNIFAKEQVGRILSPTTEAYHTAASVKA